MSTAWYKPSVLPKLIKSFPSKSAHKQIEVWTTTCIVTNFGKATKEPRCSVLVNPANPSLSGVKKFPYFPRGGPEPKEQPKKYEHHIMGYVSQWGGMEVGSGMLFPANVVDGLVHQLGGWKLSLYCKLVSIEHEKCHIGQAVSTYAGGKELDVHYDEIIHTVPPFYSHYESPLLALANCYQSSLSLAFKEKNESKKVAFPLLGAGARGFPLDDAIEIAAVESLKWKNRLHDDENENIHDSSDSDNDNKLKIPKQVLAFGIPDMKIAESLINAIEQYDN